MELYILKSVKCFLNKETGIIYPYDRKGDPDWDNPIDLNNREILPDWWMHLSPLDYLLVQEWEY
jgi:hypothetical protein